MQNILPKARVLQPDLHDREKGKIAVTLETIRRSILIY